VKLKIVFFDTNCACTQQIVPVDGASDLYCGRWIVLMSARILSVVIFNWFDIVHSVHYSYNQLYSPTYARAHLLVTVIDL
jgi:hypothetical protein